MTRKKITYGLILFCVIFCCVSLPSRASQRVQSTEETIVIVIDPGHGGNNLGTIENGFEEKSMTLVTAQAMYDELCKYDNVEVYMTRIEDVDLTLKDRARYAADLNADFLFSIHYNASVNHNLFGSEVWISAEPPYHAYGFQFGYTQLETMRDMGLYLRGVKTRLNDKGKDYYGIIREATALSVPAVIIEHCHVDEVRDYPFCDTTEEQIAFGKADATSVAKYFGLKSTLLGVDYSEEANLPFTEADKVMKTAMQDETAPDICMIEIADCNDDIGEVVLNITAADYDTPLLYYDYSYDGGLTYSPLQMWPGSDVLEGAYTDSFQLTIQIPSGTQPDIILRAYNMFDAFTQSNRITLLRTFLYSEGDSDEQVNNAKQPDTQTEEEHNLPGTQTFMPANNTEITQEQEVRFIDFLKICLMLVVGVFVLLLFSRFTLSVRRRKKRRHCRKPDGDRRNHTR